MKALLISAATIFFTSSTQAVVRPVGAFVPNECGVPRYTQAIPLVAIAEVCIGRVIANRDRRSRAAVQFRMTTGESEVFLVSKSKNLGATAREPRLTRLLLELKSREGKRAVVYVLQTREGRTEFLAGSLGVIRFEARDFEAVFAFAGRIRRGN